jgi:hypothetical protein
MSAPVKSIGRQIITGMIKALIVLVVLFVIPALIFGNRAEYQSKALCNDLVKHGRLDDKVTGETIETQLSADTKTVTFVKRGVLPFSRYWCTVHVTNVVVTQGDVSHHWST